LEKIILPNRTVDILREFTMRPIRTQPELQSLLGVSPPTAFRAVDMLRDMGVLHDGKDILPDGRGRPRTTIELDPKGLCVFALVIRSEDTQLYLLDALGHIQERVTIDVRSTESYEIALEKYSSEINNLLNFAAQSFKLTAGVGVSFAGWVDAETGIIREPSRFLDWHNKDLACDLNKKTGLQCFIENDAVSLTRATFWFSPTKIPNSFALIYIDFGLGTGFCFDNTIYTGQSHISAGLAHTNLFGWSNTPCHCGKTGCLETVLSIPSIVKQAEILNFNFEGIRTIVSTKSLIALDREARLGNQSILELLNDVGKKAGIVGATICQILELPMIVFAGSLFELSDVLWASVRDEMNNQNAYSKSPISWYRLKDVLEHELPEALGGSAVALGGLYKSKSVMVINDR
jgi:predicted NBD/HSP70 family sugar kinase